MTVNYNAGLDSSDVKVSYAPEATWNVLPAVAFKALRILSEGFTSEKTRTRPLEINPSGYAAHAITTQFSAKGALSFGLSYGTFDDLLASALNGAWTALLNINGVGGDISAVAASGTLTSTTSGKFDLIRVGSWIRTLGFTTLANNGIWRVTAVVTGASPSVTLENAIGTLVNETPTGVLAKIRGRTLQNGAVVSSFQLQKQLAAALFLRYGGAYPTSLDLSMEVGKYVEASMNFLVASEQKATTDASTGAVTAAPTSRIIDNISGFKAFAVNGSMPTAVLQSVDLNLSKQRAASQYGIGSAAAAGMRRGTFQLDGKLALFFADFTYYNSYLSETDLRLSWELLDSTGQAYVLTLPACTIMNPQITAKGIDQDIVAEFALEGNPADASDPVYGGVTLQIDQLPLT
jgi:hypothetical protein